MTRHSLLLFCWLLFGFSWVNAHAQETAAKTSPAPTEIQSVIDTLENTEARERLIGQLKVLLQAQQTIHPSHAEPTLGSTTIVFLKDISDQLSNFVENTEKVASLFHGIPRVADWLERQISDMERRNLWLGIIQSLAGIMGCGYLALFTTRWLLKPFRETLKLRPAAGIRRHIFYLFVMLLLALLPIVTFATAGYAMLGAIHPTENIRLVAIVWINAAVFVRVMVEANRFFFAPQYPQFRFLPVGDQTALYADRWMRGLGITAVYGYFALQAALLIGMPLPYYETLLRLLGLLVTGLLIALILQNRLNASGPIRDTESSEAHPRQFLRQLASIWHVVAIAYILLLYGIWAFALTGGLVFILKGTLLTVLILVTGNAAVWLSEQAFRRRLWVDDALLQRFPSLEQRLNRYLPALQIGAKGLVYLFMSLAMLQAWGFSTFDWITGDSGKAFSGEIVKIGGIVLVTLLIWDGTALLMESYLAPSTGKFALKQPSPRQRTLLFVAHNALLIVLIVISTLTILSDLGINIAPLLAGAGVAGLAIGFGAQKLVQDIITGLFILFEDLISVGDVVSVDGKDGLVEAITIRTVRLRDLAGNVHTIPFSSIGPITNMTRDFSYYVFEIGVSYREDIDVVMAELKAIGQEMMQDSQFSPLILESMEILGVDGFASAAVMIKARIKTLPIKQWEVGREFNRRMKKRFDKLAIDLWLPTLTLIRGETDKPDSPTVNTHTSKT